MTSHVPPPVSTPAILLRHRVETSLHHAWFRLKLALGQNVRVDKNFFAGHAVVSRSLGRLPPGVRITCAGRSDGIGMQALARLSGIVFARLFGAAYVHAPFEEVDHASADETARWEKLFRLGEGFERVDPARHRLRNYAQHIVDPKPFAPQDVLVFQQFWWLTRRYPALLTQCAPFFRSRFDYAGETSPETAQGHMLEAPAQETSGREILRVAAHVRRGDVSRERNSLRYTPDAAVLARIAQVQAAARDLGLACAVEVHSQGDPADFAAYAEQGCALRLNCDAPWTMRQLAGAQVLITARSSFSFVAGLMNPGLVIYERAFNPPPPEWLACDGRGRLEPRRLRAALACSVERTTQEKALDRLSANL